MMHPSRRAMIDGNGPPRTRNRRRNEVTTVLTTIWMRPHVDDSVGTIVPPLAIGTREQFNIIRIELVNAMNRFLESIRRPPLTSWIYSPTQLDFAQIPPVHNLDVIPMLSRHGLLGVYWLVNHDDTSGTLSCGQLYDLLCSLSVLQNSFGLENAWPLGFYAKLCKLLGDCMEASASLSFTLGEPPLDGPAIGALLSNLQKFIPNDEEYDPSLPSLTTPK